MAVMDMQTSRPTSGDNHWLTTLASLTVGSAFFAL